METEKNSFLPFTEEELKKLNFTPEELEILEDASAYSQTVDMIPEDFDTFANKVNDTFSDEDDANKTFEKIGNLCSTDQDFINQMIALQEVYSAVKIYNEEDSESEK